MGLWTATVYETLTRMVQYEVEADNIEDAKGKLSDGETTSEIPISANEVIGRVLSAGPPYRAVRRD